MSTKAFLGMILLALVAGGVLGGVFVGGIALGEQRGRNEAQASAQEQASQQFEQLRQRFQSQFSQAAQSSQSTQSGTQAQGQQIPQGTVQGQRQQTVQGTPQPGGQFFAGQGQSPFGALRGGQVGTVEKVEGNKLTLNTASGVVEVALSPDTTVSKTATGTLSDIQPGLQVTVTGQRDESGVLKASTVVIVPEGVTGVGFTLPVPGGQGGLRTPSPR